MLPLNVVLAARILGVIDPEGVTMEDNYKPTAVHPDEVLDECE
jgi:hypothetical protein